MNFHYALIHKYYIIGPYIFPKLFNKPELEKNQFFLSVLLYINALTRFLNVLIIS